MRHDPSQMRADHEPRRLARRTRCKLPLMPQHWTERRRARCAAATRVRTTSMGSGDVPDVQAADFCLAEGLDAETMLAARRARERPDPAAQGGHPVSQRATASRALYAIRSGSCKIVSLSEDGQRPGRRLPHVRRDHRHRRHRHRRHGCEAVALEDTRILRAALRSHGGARHGRTRASSTICTGCCRGEIARERAVMLLLGTMRAERRLAAFLLDLSQRYHARGYSSCEFVLRMTREEIGSYLGLKLETVSRLFSRFQREGLLQVQGRVVKLLDRVIAQAAARKLRLAWRHSARRSGTATEEREARRAIDATGTRRSTRAREIRRDWCMRSRARCDERAGTRSGYSRRTFRTCC